MMKNNLSLALAAAAVLAFTGCSSSSGSSKDDTTEFTGALVDDGVQGVTYVCGGTTDVTGPNGHFTCSSAPVSFSLGNISLGSIDTITSDFLVFPQDIVGIPRDAEINASNPLHATVANMSVLFQSLDSDGDPSNGITIAEDTVTLLNQQQTSAVDLANVNASQMQTLVHDVVAEAVAAHPDMSPFTEEAALANLALTVETPPAPPAQPGTPTGSEGGN